ncbi:recombination protein NinG [Pseudomonas sp. S12(2018)]|uniref:recombination protein NinG n=1 Tax=Pseudomonas sp. S12(2018) TaxID=2219664 RepID=UPI0020CB8D8C|nr:recombination protein NinG [Pseudomonas sp. S12(2018)]MCQ0168453.1 recombination protein NinG [Pseudomonas sp. S12(2018)]
MSLPAKQPRPKKCKNPACGISFSPRRLGQAVCSPACGLAIAPANLDKARKAIDQRERREIKVRKEKLKSRTDHLKEAQVVVNQYIRLRDADLPCVSCGRFHDGQWHAGHFRSAGGHPELRFEPLNIWRQCAPCNTHKSGDLVNYRAELVRRIGAERVEWLEGPHEAKRYTVDDLKAIKAEYRAKIKQLKEAA